MTLKAMLAKSLCLCGVGRFGQKKKYASKQ